jgi:ferredoxin
MSDCRTVRVVHFSGTGCTSLVAATLRQAFVRRGLAVEAQELRAGVADLPGMPDLLAIAYAVHGCNAPHPVYEWIKRLPDGRRPDGQPSPVLVVANSGGGEVKPNKACRVGVIKRLQKRGYRVVYDKMIVMPSNWIVETKEALAARLLEVLPAKVEFLVAEVLAGRELHSRPGPLDRLISALGEGEKLGAREFGRRIRVSSACNGCGLCARHCPAANIRLENRLPVFGKDCLLCLKCLYDCPAKALSPGMARFILVPAGFSLAALHAKLPWPEPVDVAALAEGWVWAGVRKYLLETADCAPLAPGPGDGV